jgi:hypothetical protein
MRRLLLKVLQLRVVTFTAGMSLAACGPAIHQQPRTYAQSTDSASAACRRNPRLCGVQPGEHSPTVPSASGASRLIGAPEAALNIDAAAKVVGVAIDASLEARIRKALSECADDARSQVLLDYFGGGRPTHEKCNEIVGTDSNGKPVTRAMKLGVEQHRLALLCVQGKLQDLKPGGFSLSLRYRVDPNTGLVQYLSQTQVKALLDAGRSAELLGTIEPDVIIHGATPLQVQVLFDFKFPCVNGGQPGWRRYPEGHPHHEYSQKEIYETLLKTRAFRVVPRWGILN